MKTWTLVLVQVLCLSVYFFFPSVGPCSCSVIHWRHSVQRRRLPASELCVFLEHDENTECAVSNSDTFVFCSSNKKFEMVLIFAVKISIG